MTTWYHYCHTCKHKSAPMTEEQSEKYCMPPNPKPAPVCCGKPMGLRSDNFLVDIFQAKA